jgi:hypothetical protein
MASLKTSVLTACLLFVGACGGDPKEAEAPADPPADSAEDLDAMEEEEAIDGNDDVNDEIGDALSGGGDDESEEEEY